jgi:hypothetical protein
MFKDLIITSNLQFRRNKINKLRIGELAIAGTHNAGAWRFNTEMSNLKRDSFVLCQDRSVWAQLVHGIRYLDFRIAYYDFYPEEQDRWVALSLPPYLNVLFATNGER